jgi:excisionase family DNA binding protein
MVETRFYTMETLPLYISLSKSTIYKMVSQKTIPHIKIGTRTLFDRQQIDKWVLNGGRIEDDLPQLPKI